MVIEVQIKQPNAGASRTLRFSQSPVRLGRNQLNDIPLDDPFVSEWHGIIRFDAASIAYFDLGSTNGTILDGKRLAKNVPAVLSESSRLQLGMLEVTVAARADEPKVELPHGRSDTGPLKTLAWGPGSAPPAPSRPSAAAVRGPATADPRSPQSMLSSTAGWGSATPPPPAASVPQAGQPPAVSARSGAAAGSIHGSAPIAATPPPPAADPAASVNAAMLARMTKLIEAFSEAFVGLRKGYEQFGAEVGVRTVSGATALHRARNANDVLDYLMQPNTDPRVAARELIAIYADLGIHHIALMEGITEGVRAVLQSMDPRTNDLDVSGGGGLFSASKTKNKWKAYLQRFDTLVTDDGELHAAIFGDTFARAYASVAVGDGRDSRKVDES